jgi:hypothetical protein
MSDIDEKLRDMQRTAEVITGKVIMWLGKEAAKGAIYAVVANFIQNRVPSLIQQKKSDAEILQELMQQISLATGSQPTLQPSQEETIKRIIREELMKAYQAPQVVAPTAPTPIVTRETELGEIERIKSEIEHCERMLRLLDERWVRGELKEEEYRKMRNEFETKLGDLRLKKERIERILVRT